ncbi:VWA domain-containing protein [bacterium]|nr:VWA domain-containing protein [candidate division CSSED10-310 bacterium]
MIMAMLPVFGAAAVLYAQTPADGDPQDIGYGLRISVEMVRVSVTAQDRFGRYVTGLGESDFEVFEEGESRRIVYFSSDTSAPKSIGMLLDVSGSMRILDKISRAKGALELCINYLKPRDRASLIFFADGAVEVAAPFGASPAEMIARLRGVEAYGKTAIHDAVAAMPGLVGVGGAGMRKAVILVTDGYDNASERSLEQAIRISRIVNLPIYTIGMDPVLSSMTVKDSDQILNRVILQRIAEETGGRCFLVRDDAEVRRACAEILEELGSQYVLGFMAGARDEEERFRTIQVKVKRRGVRIRTRKGYIPQ